jgi:hypothetical protein
VERELPGADPFPELAVTPELVVVVIEGAAPDRLVLHRLTAEGWRTPVPVRVR